MQRCVMATGAERLMQTVQAAARKPKFRVICGFFGPVRDLVSCFSTKILISTICRYKYTFSVHIATSTDVCGGVSFQSATRRH